MPDYWNLQTLWFGLIAVLWIGYFFLEGFDFGVGILLPFLGRDETDRRLIVNSIGPVWDGNEVWLLVAGGATFAAFPEWYATVFSGFYLALFLILAALIFRAVAFEYRGKSESPSWRRWWDRAIFFGSALPALLWGVAFADFIWGVPLTPKHEFAGSFGDLVSPFALLGGATFLVLFVLHGALFLALKTTDDLRERARAAAGRVWWPAAGLGFAFLAAAWALSVSRHDKGVVPDFVPILALACILAVGWIRREGWELTAFLVSGAGIALLTLTIFLNLYPRVLIASNGAANNLTIFNASSSHYTLIVMTIVALFFTPIVLGYQAWTYWVFRKRIGRHDIARSDAARLKPAGASPDGAAAVEEATRA